VAPINFAPESVAGELAGRSSGQLLPSSLPPSLPPSLPASLPTGSLAGHLSQWGPFGRELNINWRAGRNSTGLGSSPLTRP